LVHDRFNALPLEIGGAAASLAVAVQPTNGFAGTVNLSLEGLPSGVTVIGTTATAGTSAQLQLQAGPQTAPGTYTVTVRGKTPGADGPGTVAERTVTVDVRSPVPGFTLSATPAEVTLVRDNASAAVNVTLARTIFTGNVSLAVSGVPAGNRFTIEQPGTGNTGSVRFFGAPIGTFPITITASAPGLGDRTATVTLRSVGYTLTATPATQTIIAGTSGAPIAINVERLGGFAGAVSLVAEGRPSGVTAFVIPPGANNSGSVTFTASAQAVPGTYTVTMRGTTADADMPGTTVPITLVVAAPPPTASYTLSVTPTEVTVVRDNATATATVALARTDFTGSVSLAVSGVPAGNRFEFTSPGTGNTGSVRFFGAPIGVHPVTITASALGLADRTATVTLRSVGYALTATPGTQTVTTGTSGAPISIAVERLGGFAGAVSLVAEGRPSGVTAAVTSPGTGSSGSVTFTASAQAVPGTYTVTMRGTTADADMPGTTVPITLVVAAPPPVAGYTLGVSPATITVTRGTAGTDVDVALVRSGGFAGAVSLAVSTLPSLVAAEITEPGTGSTGRIRFTAGSLAVPATFPVTVTSSAAGLADRTATVSVRVVVAPGLAVYPINTVSVARGASRSSPLNIFRIGEWTGAVSFEATGVPSGLTVGFDPNPITGDQTTLTVTAAAGMATGTYTFTVRGTGVNGTVGTITVTVQVTS
jgi:hypothetical protein